MQSLTAYFFISLKHEVSLKDLCLFCVTCIRPLIHYEKLQTNLGNFYQQIMKADIICVTAINIIIKSHLFAPTEQRICSSFQYVDEWTLPTTRAAVMFLHKANRLCTTHRWLSSLSIGLSGGRSWVQLWPDQHSGSIDNWGESSAFVITSANG